MMRAAIKNLQEGNTDALPMRGGIDVSTIHGPISNDTIGTRDDWKDAFVRTDAERRAACTGWDAKV